MPDPQVLTDLATAVAGAKGAMESATTLINGIAAKVQAAVDAALANGATAAQLAPVSDLVTEEAVVLAASLPAWITNTKYSTVANTKQLLNALFIDKQAWRNMPFIPDVTRLSKPLLASKEYTAYNLLWMRSASQILYNHRADTFIPLVRTMTIDSDKKWFQVKVNKAWKNRTLYKLYQEAYTPWKWQPKLKKYYFLTF